jgi:predicted RNA-binding Zn-ribbon protein involved in translation (DUF1610 family)
MTINNDTSIPQQVQQYQQQQQQPYQQSYADQDLRPQMMMMNDSTTMQLQQQQPIPAQQPPLVAQSSATSATKVVINKKHLGENPVRCTCSNCGSEILTRTERKTSAQQWLASVLLVVFGCVCGCCLIPFCIPSMKKTIHSCPRCGHRFN